MYNQLAYNSLRLLSARTAKLLSESQEGNYNPYTKQQIHDDTRLKETMQKYYTKMVKMERKKYRKPLYSESMIEMAQLIGCQQGTETDNLSRHEASLGNSSDEGDTERNSLFSKFTSTKRPSGFFGTQIGEANNNSGEVSVSGVDHKKHSRMR